MPLEKLQSKNQRMEETHRALYNQLSSFGGQLQATVRSPLRV
jgi:hypothetical protein